MSIKQIRKGFIQILLQLSIIFIHMMYLFFRTLDYSLISEYYTRCCINTIRPPDDEHSVARNMQRITIINISYNVIVYQVGHLPRVIPGCTHGQQNTKYPPLLFISAPCNSPSYTNYKTNYLHQCIVLKSFTL